MYHSLYFTYADNSNWGDRQAGNPSKTIFNTWDDWGLIPTEVPIIAMPTATTSFTDVEGVSGAIDTSEALVGVPVYGNRTGSITLDVADSVRFGGRSLSNVGGEPMWSELYSYIANFMHNKKLKMWLEDDPEYYYIGRWTVDSLGSSDKRFNIKLSYNLYPYKISKLETTASSMENWIWDDFNFTSGSFTLDRYRVTIDSDRKEHTWTGTTNFGSAAPSLSLGIVTPILTVTQETSTPLKFTFSNRELNQEETFTFSRGSYMNSAIQFSNLTRNNVIKLTPSSDSGTGVISFRMRRLML